MALSIITSVGSILVALISLVFSYLNSNKAREFERKKLETKIAYDKKFEVFENLLKELGKFANDQSPENVANFTSAIYLTFIVDIPKALEDELWELVKLLNDKKYNKVYYRLSNLLTFIGAGLKIDRNTILKDKEQPKKK